ncbi:CHASE2 domain-containing protein [Parvularcula sp. LCG005]|uniref:CHASE2 domain-containing protein n=1 Tax=Parvularcula sp. LCG005 TaxID=3078805 RepID=UPI00294344D9|nr:CHASE2 domain-containing protein [Parvularcula sp. LCG005]WOI54125.1 CHASE2 domain-containing protein [Parvularcula sp. LCG005]
MFQQRLQQRLRYLLAAPALLLLAVVAHTLTTAQSTKVDSREAIFDLYSRAKPRIAPVSHDVVLIEIDEESLERIGPWPWPRTAYAGIVNAAEEAGAKAVVLTVPIEGQDPLSPEVVARYWQNVGDRADALHEIAQLPTNNAGLAAAALNFPTALSVGQTPARRTDWQRADTQPKDWISLRTEAGNGFLALLAAPLYDTVDAGLSETALLSVSALPVDGDGHVRRVPVLWSVEERPVPSAALAGWILAGDTIEVTPSSGSLQSGGSPPSAIRLGEQFIPLQRAATGRLWLPPETDLPSVPAWRVLQGDGSWTQPLRDKIVFVGETSATRPDVKTARGRMSINAIHGQFAEQMKMGAVPRRPGWTVLVEALGALFIGAITIGAALYLRHSTAAAISVALAIGSFAACYMAFAQSALLIDPIPMIYGAVGMPLAVLVAVIANMLVRDDFTRGAFHGALPQSSMSKLQSRGGAVLLRGVRREITVLSCALRLPQAVVRRFEGRPDDFIRFTASANDALRRTILAHGGTVDFGEDGRLLGYWNVPDEISGPIEKACACALKMIDDVNTLSENVQTAAFAGEAAGSVDDGFAEGSLEIGLASAESFAGPVGRGNRNRYSVIGESVRLASALRQRAGQYGPAIIADDVVFDALRHHYAFLDLDIVKTGPEAPVRTVYGLVGNPFLKASKAFRQLADTQRELVLSWRNGDLAATTVQLQRLRGIPGVPDAYIQLFDDRLTAARTDGTPLKDPADVIVL